MLRAMNVCGQEFDEKIITQIREAVSTPEMTRFRLARKVCESLNWRHPDGRLKEMNCRKALLKLKERKVIELPEAHPTSFRREKNASETEWVSFKGSLSEVGELELLLVDGRDKALSKLWWEMMQIHHPLGGGPLCGAQLRYLVRSKAGWLGGVSFSAAAWRVTARDKWIGWDESTRYRNLSKIVNNSRFLILPTVQVKNLASRVLALVLKRLPQDWQNKYDEEPLLVETFVDSSKNRGTCYQAANWIDVGLTQGRGRQDRSLKSNLTRKHIFIYPLRDDSRMLLCDYSPIKPAGDADRTRQTDWVEEEFGKCKLGDARLLERLKIMARDFYAKPTVNIPQACGSRAKTKAAYRFLDNEDTSLKTLLAAHYDSTEQRVAREAVVLAVQDTCELDYTTLRQTEGLGPIGNYENGAQGLLLHSTLTFNLAGTPLGLIDAQCWHRQPADSRRNHKELDIEDKESRKWLESYRTAAKLQERNPGTMLVSIGDREADIYEFFHEASVQNPDGPKVLIRSKSNRRVQGEHALLRNTLEQQTLAGVQLLAVPRKKDEVAREAHMEVRIARVTLRAPKNLPKATKDKRANSEGKLPNIVVWAILAQEKISSAAGVKPLDWLLLTTMPVENFDQAAEKLLWYSKRWGIEVFHRTIKSGCRIEDRQLCNSERLETCLAIDLVVAWRIYHMTQLSRENPNSSCEACFSEEEWKSLKVYATGNVSISPEPPPLRDAIRLVAALGGFLGRKCDGEPGTQTIWRGLQRLSDLVAMYKITVGNSSKKFDVPQLCVSRETDYG